MRAVLFTYDMLEIAVNFKKGWINKMIKVNFVCLGNICRSPMAEAVMRQLILNEGLEAQIEVDSSGTSDWHIGKVPHEGTLAILEQHSIPTDGMFARQYEASDLETFDYIVAMDESNIENMVLLNGGKTSSKVFRFLDIVEKSLIKDLPDPYYTGDFDETYDLVTQGCQALLELIKKEKSL